MRRAATLGIRAALRTSTTAPAAQCLNAYAAAPVVSQRHPARWTDAISSRGFASESDDDFKPKVHAQGGDEVQSAIAQDVKENRVLLYMKGTPAAPQCGFSNMAIQILNFHNTEFATRNVLASDDLRNGIKRVRGRVRHPEADALRRRAGEAAEEGGLIPFITRRRGRLTTNWF